MRPIIPFIFRLRTSAAIALIGTTLGLSVASGAKIPAATPAAAAPVKATNAPVTFDSFRLLTERNIFNPNRVGRTIAGPAAQPRGDEIRLVGALDSTEGLFAFFDSPESTYRQTLHEGGAIAGFTVKHIGADRVELTRSAGPITLRIGQLLHRPVGGDWSVDASEIIPPTETTASAAPAAAATIPADASATLKRLMEQRQKQLQQ
ncbi:MAG TPA: hypothetical protein VGM64_21750 [Lacunisphaera sp.]|jgi:hypothetical protein